MPFSMDVYFRNQSRLVACERKHEEDEHEKLVRMPLLNAEKTGQAMIDLYVVEAWCDEHGLEMRTLQSYAGKAVPVRQFMKGDEVQFHTTGHERGDRLATVANVDVFVTATITCVTNTELTVQVTSKKGEEMSHYLPECTTELYAMFPTLNLLTYTTWQQNLEQVQECMNTCSGKEVLKCLFMQAEHHVHDQPLLPLADTTHLNAAQYKTFFQSLYSTLTIIHGPPGTGKSTALMSIIENIVLNKKRVLVCAASNAAIDQLLGRVMSSKDIPDIRSLTTRVGKPPKVASTLQDLTAQSKANAQKDAQTVRMRQEWANCYRKNGGKAASLAAKLVQKVANASSVVACTLTRASTLQCDDFDYVIIDEAAQATEVACLGAIMKGKKLILAGDHLQLPPVVHSDKAKSLAVTLFERCVFGKGRISWLPDMHASVQERIVLLNEQHRMNEHIMSWSSKHLYNGKLKAAPKVAKQVLADTYKLKDYPLLQQPQVFVDTHTQCLERSSGVGKVNVGEISIVMQFLRFFAHIGLPMSEIGIISPYKAQVNEITHVLTKSKLPNVSDVEVKSVDGFQGSEKTVIILSCVRSNDRGSVGFLNDKRRMNVAITRAKKMVCIIGDVKTLQRDKLLRTQCNHHKQWTVLASHLQSLNNGGLLVTRK